MSRLFGWWHAADGAAHRALRRVVARLDARLLRRHALRARAARRSCRTCGMTTSTAGLIGSATLVAAAAGGVTFGWSRIGSAARAPSWPASSSTPSSPRRAGWRRASCSLPCSASCSEWGWAASGPAARRSCRKSGLPSTAVRRSAFMQSAWAIGYGARGACHRARSCRAGAGAGCSSSASCPRSSRCGSGAACVSRRCGSRREPKARSARGVTALFTPALRGSPWP